MSVSITVRPNYLTTDAPGRALRWAHTRPWQCLAAQAFQSSGRPKREVLVITQLVDEQRQGNVNGLWLAQSQQHCDDPPIHLWDSRYGDEVGDIVWLQLGEKRSKGFESMANAKGGRVEPSAIRATSILAADWRLSPVNSRKRPSCLRHHV